MPLGRFIQRFLGGKLEDVIRRGRSGRQRHHSIAIRQADFLPGIIYLFVVPHKAYLPMAQIRWLRNPPSLVYIFGREQLREFLLAGTFLKEKLVCSMAVVVIPPCSPQTSFAPLSPVAFSPSPISIHGVMIHN